MRVIVGFSTRAGLLSRVIRWLTRSTVSHTWFLVHDPLFQSPMVWEAGIRGFLPTPARKFWRTNKVRDVFVLDVGPAALSVAGNWVGRAYDVPGLLGMLVPLVGRWFRKKWRNPATGAGALFCSEVVARILERDSFPWLRGARPDALTPEDLRTLLRRAQSVAASPVIAQYVRPLGPFTVLRDAEFPEIASG